MLVNTASAFKAFLGPHFWDAEPAHQYTMFWRFQNHFGCLILMSVMSCSCIVFPL